MSRLITSGFRLILALVLVAVSAGPVLAGPYGDELSKCLVSSTTEKDKTDLVRWIFAATSLHPDVSGIIALTDAQRTEMTRLVGQLFERLLTESCRTQYRDAMLYEGNSTLETSFAVLGQVAMRRLMEHPAVAKGLGELQNFVDQEKLKAVLEPEKPAPDARR